MYVDTCPVTTCISTKKNVFFLLFMLNLEKTRAVASEVSTRGSRVPTVAEDS